MRILFFSCYFLSFFPHKLSVKIQQGLAFYHAGKYQDFIDVVLPLVSRSVSQIAQEFEMVLTVHTYTFTTSEPR